MTGAKALHRCGVEGSARSRRAAVMWSATGLTVDSRAARRSHSLAATRWTSHWRRTSRPTTRCPRSPRRSTPTSLAPLRSAPVPPAPEETTPTRSAVRSVARRAPLSGAALSLAFAQDRSRSTSPGSSNSIPTVASKASSNAAVTARAYAPLPVAAVGALATAGSVGGRRTFASFSVSSPSAFRATAIDRSNPRPRRRSGRGVAGGRRARVSLPGIPPPSGRRS